MRWFLVLLLLAAACSKASESVPRVDRASGEGVRAAFTQVSGRAPTGSLVMLEPVSGPAPLPQGPAVMDQFSKAFIPEVLFVRVGQAVTFKNSEDQEHNVAVTRMRTGTSIFNISQSQGDAYSHTFHEPTEYDVTCDIHPGMRATVVATTTPYAVYSKSGGEFAMADVAPGRYTLQLVASGRSSGREVEVSGERLDLGDITRSR